MGGAEDTADLPCPVMLCQEQTIFYQRVSSEPVAVPWTSDLCGEREGEEGSLR